MEPDQAGRVPIRQLAKYYLRLDAPVAGTLRSSYAIGQRVAAGEVIARIDETPLAAPLGGVLRGLTHDGVPVAPGTKVIEIDPRGDPALVRGIGERPPRIADGVLRAIDAALSPP